MFNKISCVVIFALCLTSCNSNIAKKYSGKMKPDEFAVSKNNPLVIPNNFTLPSPGSDSVLSKQQLAENNIPLSDGEKKLLEKTKDFSMDPRINQKLTEDKKVNLLKQIF